MLVSIKLVLHPILVYLLLSWIGGFDPVWVFTAVLMAALPPAANVYVLAQQYNVYVQPATTAILVGTMVSIVTVTLTLSAIVTGALPVRLFY